MHQLSYKFAFRNIAAGHEPVPSMLPDGITFAGQKGFVGCTAAGADNGIRHHLIPCTEHHQIILHQLIRRAGDFLTVADRMRLGCVQQLQLFNGALGSQLLNGADEGIGKHHPQEQHISVRANQQQAGRQGKVQQIEQGKEIAHQDLPNRLARVCLHLVGKPVPLTSRHFFRCKSCIRCWNIIFRHAGWNVKRFCHADLHAYKNLLRGV